MRGRDGEGCEFGCGLSRVLVRGLEWCREVPVGSDFDGDFDWIGCAGGVVEG